MGLINFLKNAIGSENGEKKTTSGPKREGTAHPKQKKSSKSAAIKKTKKARPLKKTSARKKTAKKPLKKEAPAKTNEKLIGVITHHFGKIKVGIIKLKAELKLGDKIHIKGAHDDFTQSVKSMQIDHNAVSKGQKGKEVGIKVAQRVHENDKVYLVLE